MTRTEKLVYELCRTNFLSLWSFPNPIGKKGNELCDILIVCEPDIVIISVKEIHVKYSGNIEHDSEKWMKKAIDASVKQIYGAERFITNSDQIILKDKKTKIALNKKINWSIHRIAVSFGRGDKFPLKYGQLGKGFVHVFDERSIQIILQELDTITDFINYLQEKEHFIYSNSHPFISCEEDMLGYYLSNNFKFPEGGDLVIFHDDIYSGLINDKEYKKVMSDLQVSYVWDNLIKTLIEDFEQDYLLNSIERKDFEIAIRQMAKEDRNTRKVLGEQFLDFIGATNKPRVKARMINSINNNRIKYLFVKDKIENRELRQKELRLRSLVVIAKHDCDTVIGLGTEEYNPKGYSLDISYIHYPNMDENLRCKVLDMSEELGYFNNPQIRKA